MLASWKKSCDQPRQHIKKQRYYFADKGLFSQSEGQLPRGVTPRPRSGAAAESTRLRLRRNSREELPHTPTPEAKGGGREEQPHARGQGQWPGGPTTCPRAVAVRAQEGLEELSHVEGQEGQR